MRRFATWLMVGALATTGATTALAKSGNFRTHLTGDEEVPAVVTGAQGQATFKLSADGQSITYKLNVANIEDVIQAHIHIAPQGVNGNVVTFLSDRWLAASTSTAGSPVVRSRPEISSTISPVTRWKT